MSKNTVSGLSVSYPSDSALFIRNNGEIETIENVVDVAEIAEGRLQIAYEDGETELRDGLIFGATGVWKIWLFKDGNVNKEQCEYPITLPDDKIGLNGSRDQRLGCIKRLKRVN